MKQNSRKALAWAKEKCIIGFDKNPDELKMSERKESRAVRIRC